MLTQAGPEGIRYDINHGARVVLPARSEGSWRVRLRDLDTGNILFESENQGAEVSSSKRYFVRFGIEIWDLDAAGAATPVVAHAYDARGREVLIQFPIGTLGDILAWLVVMISGFTHPNNEFDTPYRVTNWHTCNGCWNDVRHRFDHKDFLWCPRHVGTPRQFECTKLITAHQVLAALKLALGATPT